jgi:zinc transporter 9
MAAPASLKTVLAAMSGNAEEVDAIEAEVRAAIPEAKHIDLELEHVPLAPAAANPSSTPSR